MVGRSVNACLLTSLALTALLAPWEARAQPSAPSAEGENTTGSTAGGPAAESSAAASPATEAPPGTAVVSPVVEPLLFTELIAAPATELAAAGGTSGECWEQPDTDLNGGDLPSPATVTASPEQCCTACWNTSGCGAWTFRASDLHCFLKGPSGWVMLGSQPGLTSGLVTAVTVLNFTPAGSTGSAGSAGPAGAALPAGTAPLTTYKGRYQWLPPPPGYVQGQCLVLPQSNAAEIAAGSTVFVGNTTAEACCAACAEKADCDAWVFCPDAQGCPNGYGQVYDGLACGLRHQGITTGNISESSIQFYARGSAAVGGQVIYAVPYISGYVLPNATTATSSGGGSSAAGAIAGGVAGGVVAVCLAAGLLWWRRRRRRQRRRKEDHPQDFEEKLSATLNELDSAMRNGGVSPGAQPNPSGGSLVPLGSGASVPTLSSAGSSGTIPELPFGSGILSRPDFKIDTDPASGRPILLGTGHFATVYRGSCGMEPAAIKVIKEPGSAGATSDAERQQLLREVAILKSCRSQHLVSFLGLYVTENEFVIVTELLQGGTLYRALKTGKVTWYRRGLRIAIDVARGLDYLHRRNIIHLDLKSPNVLLTEHGRAKVADVGLARMVPATQSCLSGNIELGTFPWAAPEQLLGQRCSIKADIYAYGVLLWEICTALTPVRGHMREVKVPEESPQAVADLIAACMGPQPDMRPSTEDVINVLSALLAPAGTGRESLPSRGSGGSGPTPAAPQDSAGRSSDGPGSGTSSSGPAAALQRPLLAGHASRTSAPPGTAAAAPPPDTSDIAVAASAAGIGSSGAPTASAAPTDQASAPHAAPGGSSKAAAAPSAPGPPQVPRSFSDLMPPSPFG